MSISIDLETLSPPFQAKYSPVMITPMPGDSI